jgi:hypothetical protein
MKKRSKNGVRTIQERLTHSLVKVDEFILLDIEEARLASKTYRSY